MSSNLAVWFSCCCCALPGFFYLCGIIRSVVRIWINQSINQWIIVFFIIGLWGLIFDGRSDPNDFGRGCDSEFTVIWSKCFCVFVYDVFYSRAFDFSIKQWLTTQCAFVGMQQWSAFDGPRPQSQVKQTNIVLIPFSNNSKQDRHRDIERERDRFSLFVVHVPWVANN